MTCNSERPCSVRAHFPTLLLYISVTTTLIAGHFYFTTLLLPIMLSTAKSSPPGTVRIVNVSSSAAYRGKLDFNTFKDGPARRKMPSYALYNQSKFVCTSVSLFFSLDIYRRLLRSF